MLTKAKGRSWMKKISKTAGIIDVIAKIGRAVCVITGALMLILAVLVLFFGERISFSAADTLSFGDVCFTFANSSLPALGSSKTLAACGVALYAIAAFFEFLIIGIIRKILRPMIDQKPFDESVSLNIRKLAWVELIGGFVMQITKAAVVTAVFNLYDIEKLLLSESIVGCDLNLTFDFSFVIFFAMLYLLSMVFRYGEELQTQSDETL